jgi:Predicted membrane protein
MDTADLGLLILRLVVGLTLAGHGAQKAFGWWNGPGLAAWQGALSRMGFQPVALWTVISIGAELVGGLAIAVGFLTPLAAAVLIGQAVVIIGKVHLSKGFWSGKGGIEFPLSLSAGALAIGLIGAGSVSIDNALGLGFSDLVRIGLLLAGALGGLAAIAASRITHQPATAGA